MNIDHIFVENFSPFVEFPGLDDNIKKMYSLECQSINEEDVDKSHWWKHLIAGGTAGAVSRTCTAPLDRIKIFLQVNKSQRKLHLFEATKEIWLEGGVISFWRGNGANILKVVPEIAIKFTLYDEFKKYLMKCRSEEDTRLLDRLLSGGLAGFISQTAVYPLEVMKTRLVLRKTNQSSWSCVQDIFQQGGRSPRAFYLGYVANVMGIIPYAAIDLAAYETLKNEYMAWTNSKETPNSMALLCCGVLSTLLGQTFTYPFNLIKTRKQATNVNKTLKHVPNLEYLKIIYRTQGISGLYRGLLANLMKVGPTVSIVYIVYERVRHVLDAPMR